MLQRNFAPALTTSCYGVCLCASSSTQPNPSSSGLTAPPQSSYSVPNSHFLHPRSPRPHRPPPRPPPRPSPRPRAPPRPRTPPPRPPPRPRPPRPPRPPSRTHPHPHPPRPPSPPSFLSSSPSS